MDTNFDEWDIDELENGISFSNEISEFLNIYNSDISDMLLELEIPNSSLSKKGTNIIFNGREFRIGKFLNKMFPNLNHRELEKFIGAYNLYFTGHINDYVCFNIKLWNNGNTMITTWSTTDKNERLGYSHFSTDPLNKKVSGMLESEVSGMRVDGEIIDYLKNKGYKFRTEMNEGVQQNIIYLNNGKDVFNLIQTVKNYNKRENNVPEINLNQLTNEKKVLGFKDFLNKQ